MDFNNPFLSLALRALRTPSCSLSLSLKGRTSEHRFTLRLPTAAVRCCGVVLFSENQHGEDP